MKYCEAVEPIITNIGGCVVPLCSLVATPSMFQSFPGDVPPCNIKGSKVTLALPPTILGGAYLLKPHPQPSYHHIMEDRGTCTIIMHNTVKVEIFKWQNFTIS